MCNNFRKGYSKNLVNFFIEIMFTLHASVHESDWPIFIVSITVKVQCAMKMLEASFFEWQRQFGTEADCLNHLK